MKKILYYLTIILLVISCQSDDEGIYNTQSKLNFILKVKNTGKVSNNGDKLNSFENCYLSFTYCNITKDTIKEQIDSSLITNKILKINDKGISEDFKTIPGNYLISTFMVYSMGEDKKQGTKDDYLKFYMFNPVTFTLKPDVPENILIEVFPVNIYPIIKKQPIITQKKTTFQIKGLSKRWLFFQLKVKYNKHYLTDYLLRIKRKNVDFYDIFDKFEKADSKDVIIGIIYDTEKEYDFQIFVKKKDGDKEVSGETVIKYNDLEDKQDRYGRHYSIYPSLVFIVLK